MKYFKILAILMLSSVLSFYSCNDNNKTVKEDNTKSIEVENSAVKSTETTVKPTTTPKEPAQNAGGVWHYTCRIGCLGGAGSAVKCSNCGNVLAHNTAYHSSTNKTNTSPMANPSATPAKPATPEPAQNSAGVWHYTCAKGCSGGSGSAGSCATCNGSLAHNSAYH